MATNSFKKLVHDALAAMPVNGRSETTGAVVLERIAMGGGATRWYFCPDGSHFGALEAHLSPGSEVSFYFDGRIRSSSYSPEIASALKEIVAETGEVVAGILAGDGLRIDVQIISGPNEVDEFISGAGSSSRIFYGPFPARGNDGVSAITMVLPDVDGVVRPHPY